jgi:hypothetical protein
LTNKGLDGIRFGGYEVWKVWGILDIVVWILRRPIYSAQYSITNHFTPL